MDIERYEGVYSDEGMIFENRVFNNRPFDLEEFKPRVPYSERFQAGYYDANGYAKRINRNKELYLPDHIEMPYYLRNISREDLLRKNLSAMKQLLLDESIPDHYMLSVIDAKNTTYHEDVGRLYLVTLVGELRLDLVIDELRQIMLHDLSYDMRKEAIRSISKLKSKKGARMLCEKMRDVGDNMKLREYAAREIYSYPSKHSVKPLRDTYEETQYVMPAPVSGYDADYLITRGLWMPNYCLRALGKISSLEALEGIKIGFSHPEGSVQRWAQIALWEWIETNAKLIADGKFPGDAEERKKFMHNLISDFGIIKKPTMNLFELTRLYIV